MKKNIPYILAGIAVLNLIWLFVFNYRLPNLSVHSGSNEAQAQSQEEIVPGQEGEEIALQEGTEEASGQEQQDEAQGNQEPQAEGQVNQEPQEGTQEAPAADAGQNNEGAEQPAAQQPAQATQTPAEPPQENEVEEPAEETLPATQTPQEETTNERTCRSGKGNTPNIRSGPGTNYDIIKTADFNEVMVVTGEPEHGWIPVRTKEGYNGYVSSDMVDMLD